jgi:hypothetical protein
MNEELIIERSRRKSMDIGADGTGKWEPTALGSPSTRNYSALSTGLFTLPR